MTDGDYVEHIVHRIRGVVLRMVGQTTNTRGTRWNYAEVLWDDDGSPTDSGQRFLDSNRDDDPGPVYSVTPVTMLQPVNAVDQLGELAR